MGKKFTGNLIFLVVVNLLVKPFYVFGIDRNIQLTVGADDYGLYLALFNFSLLYYMVLDMGIVQYNTRSIAQSPSSISKTLPNLLITKLGLGAVYLILVFGSARLFGYDIAYWEWLGILVANQFFISLVLYFRSNLSGLHLFKEDAIISIFDKCLLIIICSFLLWGGVVADFSITHFLLAQLLAYFLTAMMCLAIFYIKKIKLHWHFDPNLIKTIIWESLPFALLVLLTTMYMRVDAIMIERMLPQGDYEAGLYGAAFRLLDMVNMFGFMFATILYPLYARLLLENRKDLETIANLGLRWVFVLSLGASLVAYFWGEELMTLLYPGYPIGYVSRLLVLLMFTFIPVAITYIYSTLLNANANMRFLNIVAFVALIVNVLLNLTWIPSLKAEGAAWATLLTQSAVALAQVVFCFFYFNFKKLPFLILLLAGYALLVSLIAWFINDLPFFWLVEIILLGVAMILLALAARIIRLADFRERQ